MTALASLVATELLAVHAPSAGAATYYIDAHAGNDVWSGLQEAPVGAPAADGPWQSLARVAAATLQPGDAVLLRCDQSWNESLRIGASGTATEPIRVGTYPIPCNDKPAIDGATTIPAHAWADVGNGIYRAPWPANLLANGSLDHNLSGWTKWAPNGDATMALSSDCGDLPGNCLALTSGSGPRHSIASSNGFPVRAGMAYTTRFRLLAPAGVTVKIYVRRAATPWEPVGLYRTVVGTGAWAQHDMSFTSTRSVPAARLDFEVPGGGRTILLDTASVEAGLGAPTQVFADGALLEPAHHPNRGHDRNRPDSPYLAMPEDGNRTTSAGGQTGSTYVASGDDLVLPAGARLDRQVTARIRTTSWLLEERRVTGVDGNRLLLDAPTRYPLMAGYGYYLVGARWMLDTPAEWHFDPDEKALYLRMPDDQPPGSRVAAAHVATGIDVSAQSFVVVEGLQVRRVGVGVNMDSTRGTVLRDAAIADTGREGILAAASVDGRIERSAISGTTGDAIAAINASWVGSHRLRVLENTISDSAVRTVGGAPVSLPVHSHATIRAGPGSIVADNRIAGTGYAGIIAMSGSVIVRNHVSNVCLILDDCGGIYANSAGSSSLIGYNFVIGAPGNATGRPTSQTHTVGIYIDDLATDVRVLGNTVSAADHGIQLHNAYGNDISGNILYGNRKTQLWLQEQTATRRPGGDLADNVFERNQVFPLTGDPGIVHETRFADTAHFGRYDYNQHSTLLGQYVASERWSDGGTSLSFLDWRTARSPDGLPRLLDGNGQEIANGRFAAFRVAATERVPNGTFATGVDGWGSWNLTPPLARKTREACVPGQCLRFDGGASESILSSPYFSVEEGKWYRLAFDLKTQLPGESLAVLVRRGGGGSNTYERLMGAPVAIAGNGGWTRYAIVFRATKTVNARDPVTLDNGARIDFEKVQPGQSISVANVSLREVVPGEAALRMNLLANPARTPASMPCPDEDAHPEYCGLYTSFPDRTPVAWPLALAALSARIVFTQDHQLLDSDLDGIPDRDDACPDTPANAMTNNGGCAFDQDYP